ncbi:hypothetical protein [Streptomyces sp. NBC_00525]|uniref:hypothetical protein n=1 Tax=Streptomyces sp. NBC_00525 TaxID=2903660 RepID=UPI002E810EFA|nr:hypothetical protein [Streptomyces sp. NBC_00525]WUC95150.1 hypothetical protein OG710_16845 [Streptomyces sp. NBC_00525]
MLWHAIAPSYGYVKATHEVVRHPQLNSDAKILITYVQGLPQSGLTGMALSDHAKKLGIKGRAYQKAKGQLKDVGFVHEWRRQGEGGLWVTDQLFSNVPLSDDDARRLRDANAQAEPSDRTPAGGQPRTRSVGGYPPEVEEEREKNSPHPPSKAEAPEPPRRPERPQRPPAKGPAAPVEPEVIAAERVLLSLRHVNPQLHLGVREARGLAESAADWLRRGVKAAELRLALVSELPADGVRSAVGFLRHRLVHKLPEEPAYAPEVRPCVPCEGEGPEHVFRPHADETLCGPCAQKAAWEKHNAKWAPARADENAEDAEEPERLSWRERVAAVLEKDSDERREVRPFGGVAVPPRTRWS